MYHQVYGLYQSSNPVAQAYERTTFAAKAREYEMELPKITCIVHNR
jgi:hypothetical protein